MELLGVPSHARIVGTFCRSVWMNMVYARLFTLRNALVVLLIRLLLRDRFLARKRLNPAAIQLFSYFLRGFILSNLSLLDPTLLVEHVEKGGVQLIFHMELEDRRIIEVQGMVLSNQSLNVLWRIAILEGRMLLLAVVHIADHALDLGRVMEHVREVIHIVHHGVIPFSILACK